MTTKTLSPDDEQRLVERLYTQSIARRQVDLEALDARFYPATSGPTSKVHLTPHELEKSVERQVDMEMQRRRERAAEAHAKAYRSIEENRHARKMSAGAVDESVERLYKISLEKKAADLQQSRERYEFNPETSIPKPKIMSKDEFAASVARMSKPKRREYTIDEINKMYGLNQK